MIFVLIFFIPLHRASDFSAYFNRVGKFEKAPGEKEM